MKKYNSIIIGFGKGGKTLAGALAKQGEQVAIIERSTKMYGGTCINVGCLPTKSLVSDSDISAAVGGDFPQQAQAYTQAILAKERLTTMLRQKNYDKLAASPNIDIIDGFASFIDEHTIKVQTATEVLSLQADKIFINTGAEAVVPSIEGLSNNKFVYFSEQLLDLQTLPKHLVVVGGGYIGMEFASMYADFGSKVTVLQDLPAFLPREDAEVATVIAEVLHKKGIEIIRSAQIQKITALQEHAELTFTVEGNQQSIYADAVLIATGRKPMLDQLNLANAGVAITERGAIQVNEHLQTTQPHIYAMGDVTGGLQFTYISLDDYRIVLSHLLGDGSRTVHNRQAIPYSVFVNPPFSRVGMTEAEAISAGYTVRVAKLMTAAVPKAQVIRKPLGIFKAIVDAKTDLILGVHIFAPESHELINLFKLAMDSKIPYQILRDNIYTHPTISEALNDLFADIAFG